MTRTGHVAQCPPGALMLTDDAARRLAEHLRTCRPPDDPRARAIVADLIALSPPRDASRDALTNLIAVRQDSEITPRAAAEHLGITPAGVRRRINRGALPARFDGHRWWIDRRHIEERNTTP